MSRTVPLNTLPITNENDIKKHNTADDCWVKVGHKVYDITSFIQHGNHPGGLSCIIRNAGTDISEHMKMHSVKASRILDKYCIGNTENAAVEESYCSIT
jgi:cytochrome b involved in lipid metabolism